MSKQCPNCSTEGYCLELQNDKCALKHTPDCSKGATCFNEKCYSMHPVPMCQQYKACKSYECIFRHSKNRTWKCRNGAFCEDKMCQALHPVTATATDTTSGTSTKKSVESKLKSSSMTQQNLNVKAASTLAIPKHCSYAEKCVNYSCTRTHPPIRPPRCPDGADCVSSLCLRLHPPQDLDQRLLKKATHGLGGHFKAITAARTSHKEKLNAVALQSFQLLQQAPEQVHTQYFTSIQLQLSLYTYKI